VQGEQKVTDEKKPHLVDKVREMLDKSEPQANDEKPKRVATRRSTPRVPVNTISGGVNQIAGRDFYDHSTRVDKILPPPVIVKTGDGVLDAQQKAEIRRLVNEVVKDSKARRVPRTHQSVHGQLKLHMKVNSYAEILQEDFVRAKDYLVRIKGIDNSLSSARKKNPEWRRKRIAAIQTRCNERGFQPWRKKYMKEKFGRESMIDMPDSEIETLYRAVMSKK
jgi:hypothetical protein